MKTKQKFYAAETNFRIVPGLTALGTMFNGRHMCYGNRVMEFDTKEKQVDWVEDEPNWRTYINRKDAKKLQHVWEEAWERGLTEEYEYEY